MFDDYPDSVESGESSDATSRITKFDESGCTQRRALTLGACAVALLAGNRSFFRKSRDKLNGVAVLRGRD